MRVEGIVDCEVIGPANDPWFEWEGGRGTVLADWERHPEMLEAGALRFSFGGFLVRGGPLGDRVALIDCGNGPIGDGFIPAGQLPASLLARGVTPAEVTDVLLTHLHYDHTGWLAVDDAPVFPNARVHVAAADVAHFTAPDSPGLSAVLTPERLRVVADHVELFDGSCTPVPGISAVPAPGHTPGSTVFVASHGTSRVVFLGDVVHCPVQLVDAEWAVLGDVDPALAARTRSSLTQELEGAEVAGAHFPGLALGRLIGTSVLRRWTV